MNGIQLKFTNNVASPFFYVGKVTQKDLKTEAFDNHKTIGQVSMLIGHTFLNGIRFKDEKGEVFFESKWANENKFIKWKDYKIPEGKQIIGLYGNNKSHS